ncbi:hypothetical protein HDU67_009850 [Dinochytrium kinnereticum]|nr:hypothetical protein HDU67_009850 [Dinochytrium kinnereticum]
MARGKQARGKQGKMARGKQGRGKQGKMARGKQARGKQGKMARGKQGRGKQGKMSRGKQGRGKQGRMARGKQARGKKGIMSRGKPARGKEGRMGRSNQARGRQGKMSRGKQSKMSRGRTPNRGRSSQGKTGRGKMSRGKTPARGKMSQGKKSSRGQTSRGRRSPSRGKSTQSRRTSKRSRGGNGSARSRPSSRGKGSKNASGRRGTSSTRSRPGKPTKGNASGKKSQPKTVCLARRSRVSRSGGCGSTKRKSSRKASIAAKKKNRKLARPNEVAGHPVNDRRRRPKPSQKETQAMKDREAELRKHGGDEYKDIHAVVLDREKMPTHGVNADKLFQRLDNDPVARDGMNVKKVVKDENDKILGVVATVPYHESPRSVNFASERGKKAKDRQSALHNQLAEEKGLTKSQWLNHYGSQSTVVDEALPVSLGGNTHNNFALVPQPESSQQGGAMGSHNRVIQPGDNVFFGYSGDATPQHHQMYKDLKNKAKDAMGSQNTADGDGKTGLEDGIQAMEIDRRELNEVDAKDVGDTGRFVGQDGKEVERVLKVSVGKEADAGGPARRRRASRSLQ